MSDAKVASLIEYGKVKRQIVRSSFFLLWRVNSPRLFLLSSAWLNKASEKWDKRLTK